MVNTKPDNIFDVLDLALEEDSAVFQTVGITFGACHLFEDLADARYD